ncbi:hypothetical protein [Porphyromonas cangingivalis]|nr:hypothetical protein [Porphyromonas cangingivalis]
MERADEGGEKLLDPWYVERATSEIYHPLSAGLKLRTYPHLQ